MDVSNSSTTSVLEGVQKKRHQRTIFTDGQKEILEQSFAEGLTACKTETQKKKILELSLELNLPVAKIKTFVYNKTAGLKNPIRPRATISSLHSRKIVGYDLFRREVMKNCELGSTQPVRMKKAAALWKEVDPEVQRSYNDQAVTLTKTLPADYPNEEKKKYISKLRRASTDLLAKFSAVGVDAALLLVRPASNDIWTDGTPKGISFLEENPEIDEKLFYHCATNLENDHYTESTTALRKEVQTLLNQKYAAATNKPGSRFPYAKLDLIKVIGFPKGIEIKRPSCYGRHTLEEIIRQKDDIVLMVPVHVSASQSSLTATIQTSIRPAGLSQESSLDTSIQPVPGEMTTSQSVTGSTSLAAVQTVFTAEAEPLQNSMDSVSHIGSEISQSPCPVASSTAAQPTLAPKADLQPSPRVNADHSGRIDSPPEELVVEALSLFEEDEVHSQSDEITVAHSPPPKKGYYEVRQLCDRKIVTVEKDNKKMKMTHYLVEWRDTWEEEGCFHSSNYQVILPEKTVVQGKTYLRVRWKKTWEPHSNVPGHMKKEFNRKPRTK